MCWSPKTYEQKLHRAPDGALVACGVGKKASCTATSPDPSCFERNGKAQTREGASCTLIQEAEKTRLQYETKSLILFKHENFY